MSEKPLNISNFNLNSEQIRRFVIYAAELVDWNQRVNLTAIRTVEEIWTKHFCDSLSILELFKTVAIPENWIDIGTGAGFPGLPIKIVHPKIKMTLVDSVEKKIKFCDHILRLMDITATTLINRAEEIGHNSQMRESFDCAVARAVANLSTLCELGLPLVKVGGLLIAQKSVSAFNEIELARNALNILGGTVDRVEKIHLENVDDDRLLIQIRKIKATPSNYPRRPGIPSKRPL